MTFLMLWKRRTGSGREKEICLAFTSGTLWVCTQEMEMKREGGVGDGIELFG